MNQSVRLRNVEQGDLPAFFEHQRDPESVAMVVFNSRERPAFDEHWAKILADDTSLKQTVVVDGEVAGNVTSFLRDGVREVGYWLDRAYWGRGVATAALSAFLKLEKTRPLFAGVARHNVGSLRVLQKCGFLLIGSPDPTSADSEDDLFLTLTLPAGPLAQPLPQTT
ncbi:MAG: GNAT family N-acetyltransferase [Chthoniobacterales bacterium]